jgi:surface protein
MTQPHYQFKNREELRSAVLGYPKNMKKYGNSSLWDVSNVHNMYCMFESSQFAGDISRWDVSNVTNMNYMFYNSQFQGDISDWDVSNVTDMKYMFLFTN